MSNKVSDARDAFLDNLHSMATGSYLREEDKEFWEAPYPESVVNEARVIIDSLIDATRNVSKVSADDLQAAAQSAGVATSSEDGEESQGPSLETMAAIAAVTEPVKELIALSRKHDDAVLEDEEVEDLKVLLQALAQETGADEHAVTEHAVELIDG